MATQRNVWLVALCLFVGGCATPTASPAPDYQERIRAAEAELPDDPAIQAGKAGIEAAEAREDADALVEEVELRVDDDYSDGHEVRLTARLPIQRPSELSAQRDVRRAETEEAVTRLEEISLERRTELCFPSVDALVYEARKAIFEDYATRQRELLRWNEEWSASGTIDELTAARFEIEGRVRLASWETPPAPTDRHVVLELPAIGVAGGPLVQDPEQLRETVRKFHPSVAARRATAKRYAALASRERARQQPWIRFVDLSYEERSRRSRDGYGGQIAFSIPFGVSERANVERYEALVRQQRGQGEAVVQLQLAQALHALAEIREFEARNAQWSNLEKLASEGIEIADRWWKQRAARPHQIADLLDEAYTARTTVLEARERAANASCTLLATTGVPIQEWAREPAN